MSHFKSTNSTESSSLMRRRQECELHDQAVEIVTISGLIEVGDGQTKADRDREKKVMGS